MSLVLGMIIEEKKQVNHSFMLFLKLTKNKEVIKS